MHLMHTRWSWGSVINATYYCFQYKHNLDQISWNSFFFFLINKLEQIPDQLIGNSQPTKKYPTCMLKTQLSYLIHISKVLL